MAPVCVFFVAFLQFVTAYHHHLQQVFDVRNNPQYFQFNNFDNTRRANRQLPRTGGFDWDSPDDFKQEDRFDWDVKDSNNGFVFEDDWNDRKFQSATRRKPNFRTSTERVPTTTVAIPGMGTARSACENRCLITPEYNPVCGDNDMTYFSMRRLVCAQRCGIHVNVKHLGVCSIRPPRG